ncbi:SapC family protein [Steroidobacter sp. S1-65]|uniref:SapC family protein n=1 Tax=Steroidobacter gossypii TaxID=2805490 RepID=A0ABS1WRX7_9GAMM|nr:SapC family protein [Steroidobacter gossypii]MBM0103729.1 SapC family protein [Steroidobacter gossypii]
MSKHALLNNIDHKDLRVITTRSAELGDNVMLALTFPSEFRDLQAHYPIVFRKNAQGQFEPIALLGFKDGQNLFLNRHGWDASYIPLTIERQPFLIGFGADREPVMHIDLDHPRVSRDSGEPLFREFGGNTEFLERMNSVLLAIHQGMAANESFIGTLLQFELLESFVFDIQLNDGSHNRLAGFYTIHEERLRDLNGAVLERLNRTGHLQAMYMQLASLSQFRALIERMNKLDAGDR